jgi:hypothetical protein
VGGGTARDGGCTAVRGLEDGVVVVAGGCEREVWGSVLGWEGLSGGGVGVTCCVCRISNVRREM